VAAHALNTDQAKTIGVVAIVAMVLIGAAISAIVTAIVGRIVVVVVVLLLAAFVWTQRANISSAAKKCDATFLGVHLTPSNPTVRQHCQDLTH
jgi:large-conductance mechanosensitive channel